MKIKKLRMANDLLADILACNGFHARGYATLTSDAPEDLKVVGVFHSDFGATTFVVESESFGDVESTNDAPDITFSISAENYVENLREELEAVVADRDELLKRAQFVAGWNEITVGLGEIVKEMKAHIDELTAERDALQAQLATHDSEKPYAIWWLSQKDTDIIGDLPDPDDDFDFGPYLPAYITVEYISLKGRNGRGRLWVSKLLAISGQANISEYLFDAGIGTFLAEDYGGIVILGEDAKHVACFPGLLTDMDLNYWQL